MRDAEGFDEFYRTTSPRTVRYAHALTGDLADAQDLVQAAYVRAWQRWHKLSAYEHPESWVRMVVGRLATDRWRKLRTRRDTQRRVGAPDRLPPPSEDTVLRSGRFRSCGPECVKRWPCITCAT
jgi:RNA polymerase sigma-70 factor (ECF subfamily)